MVFNKWFFVGILTIFFSVLSVFAGTYAESFSTNFNAFIDMFLLLSFIVILFSYKNLGLLEKKLGMFTNYALFMYILLLLLRESISVLTKVYKIGPSLEQQLPQYLHYMGLISITFLLIFFGLLIFSKKLDIKIFSIVAFLLTILLIFLEYAGLFKETLRIQGLEVVGGFFSIEPFARDIYSYFFTINLLFLGTIFIKNGISIKKMIGKKKTS
jgi:hypothetical protein